MWAMIEKLRICDVSVIWRGVWHSAPKWSSV
jgi:hypothetical protein